jgi:hypothetical protein
MQGSCVWNRWRELNGHLEIDLSGVVLDFADLSSMNLRRANFSNASLKGTDFAHSDLTNALFALADLEDSQFLFSCLEGADMRGASLKSASFEDSNLRNANLSHANLEMASMVYADCEGIELVEACMKGANLTGTNLRNAKVSAVSFDRGIFFKVLREEKFSPIGIWKRRYDLLFDTTVRCKGAYVSSCYGSQRFRIFLEDLDYLEERLDDCWGKPILFIWWLLADCGRSMVRWTVWSLLIAFLFASVYWLMGPGHFHTSYLPFNFMTMIYYSMVTFTTLGFGDVAPKTHLAAILITSEVITGYIMLGGLISIFSNKLAQRSR